MKKEDALFPALWRFLGRAICHRWKDTKKRGIRTSYLCGMLDTYREGSAYYRLRILHIKVYVRIGLKLSILGLPYHMSAQSWLERLDAKIPPNYDDVYLFRHHLGETCIELMYFASRVAAMGSKSPLIIARNSVYKDLVNMYLPKGVDCICVPIAPVEVNDVFDEEGKSGATDIIRKCGNRRYICSVPRIVERLGKSRRHFCEYIIGELQICSNAPYATPKVSHASHEAAMHCINSLYLNKKQYVLIAPEAAFMRPLPLSFWQEIVNSLKARGYEVLLNAAPGSMLLDGVHCVFPQLSELYALAQSAYSIICMGSGLAALLVSTGVKMDILYTPSGDFDENIGKGQSTREVLQMYTLTKMPNAHPYMIEYDVTMFKQQDLIQQMLTRYLG